MRKHPVIGERICRPLAASLRVRPHRPQHHHERWDGFGYPDRLRGPEIPIGARIVGLVDAFDAMTDDRPYRAGLPPDEAVEEIRTRTPSSPRASSISSRAMNRVRDRRPAADWQPGGAEVSGSSWFHHALGIALYVAYLAVLLIAVREYRRAAPSFSARRHRGLRQRDVRLRDDRHVLLPAIQSLTAAIGSCALATPVFTLYSFANSGLARRGPSKLFVGLVVRVLLMVRHALLAGGRWDSTRCCTGAPAWPRVCRGGRTGSAAGKFAREARRRTVNRRAFASWSRPS